MIQRVRDRSDGAIIYYMNLIIQSDLAPVEDPSFFGSRDLVTYEPDPEKPLFLRFFGVTPK